MTAVTYTGVARAYSPDVLSTTTLPPCSAAPGHPDPLAGTVVAHYAIVSRLGGGGQGVVYLAKDTKLNRLVALKFLPQQCSDDDCARERFIREARAASAVEHPNVCAIHAIESTDAGHLFIVMAYCDGQTLKRKLQDGPLPVDGALKIAIQIADGLTAAHMRGVVHRDVKPGNLMLTASGIKIIDFGLASLMESSQITTDGAMLGTAAYMSPEQTRGEGVDARTDIWSVGIVLYEMLVGRTPFGGCYSDAVCYAIRNDQPRPFGARAQDIPVDLQRVVLRAVEKDPSKRWQSASDLASALRSVLRHHGDSVSARPAFTLSSEAMGSVQPWRTAWTRLKPSHSALFAAVSVVARAVRSSTGSLAGSPFRRVVH